MIERTPADPPSVGGDKGLTSAFAPRAYIRTGEPGVEQRSEQRRVEPSKSFFRGVAVGIAIMVPIWAWVIIRFLH
jgi:hypothetical protein